MAMHPRAEVLVGGGVAVVAALIQPAVGLAQQLGWKLTSNQARGLLALTALGVLVGVVMVLHGFGIFGFVASLRLQLPLRRVSRLGQSARSSSEHSQDPEAKAAEPFDPNLYKQSWPGTHPVKTPAPTVELAVPASDEDSIEVDLRRLIAKRLDEIPLRGYETRIITLILRDAIQSLENLPFVSMQPGNSATDVQFTGARRRCSDPSNGEQMWHIPTKFKGLGGGFILSDQTLETLDELHGRLMKLRQEVYDRYHPPTMPRSSP